MISAKKKLIFSAILILVICSTGFIAAHYSPPASHYQTKAEQGNIYVRFDMEAYDLISKNYWQAATSSDLAKFFQLSFQKAENAVSLPILSSEDRTGVANMLYSEFEKATTTETKKQLAVNILNVALYNLAPQGRNELMSLAQETQLRQTVANINSSNDLYQNLGLAKNADIKSVNEAYKKKKEDLSKATTTEAKTELAKVSYAYKVLSNPNNKKTYDESQVEPTIFSHIIGNTLYLYMDKISPTTLAEFGRAVDSASTTPGLSNMIIDLRGNIGGDLSFPQYFFGLFLGPNQYVFDLYHQGDYQAQRTVTAKFSELDRYKEYAVLTDNMTQSTAELLVAIFKKFNIAHVVGAKTRGWGSVENTYPINTIIDPNQKYSLFLVNNLTLRDDNQPIEINGVMPNVDTSTSNWKQNLSDYFRSLSLINAIEKSISEPPVQ